MSCGRVHNLRQKCDVFGERDTKIAAAAQRRARALFVLCFCECMCIGVKFINKSRGVKVKCVASNITKHKWMPHNINERSQSDAIKWKISKIKKNQSQVCFCLIVYLLKATRRRRRRRWTGREGAAASNRNLKLKLSERQQEQQQPQQRRQRRVLELIIKTPVQEQQLREENFTKINNNSKGRWTISQQQRPQCLKRTHCLDRDMLMRVRARQQQQQQLRFLLVGLLCLPKQR